MLEIATWFAFALTVFGYELVVRKRWQGYVVWTFTNIFWIGINLYTASYAEAAMFGVFCFYTARGLLRWRKEEHENNVCRTG
jgi:nicotinamide riboside transporter PnuC